MSLTPPTPSSDAFKERFPELYGYIFKILVIFVIDSANMLAYAKEMGVLMTRLLRLLSKGLGLEEDYLKMRLGDQPLYKCHGNYYPPCPDPDHAIGLPIHSDSLALTVVRTLDEIQGLQILKDDKWIAADQLPNSFIININDQLQVSFTLLISRVKLKFDSKSTFLMSFSFINSSVRVRF